MKRNSRAKRSLVTIDDESGNEQPAEKSVRNEGESPLTPQNAQEWQEKVAKLEDTNERLMRIARRDQSYIDSLEKQLEKKPNDNGEKKMVAELTQKVQDLTQQLEEMQKEMDERKSTHARQLEVVVAASAASRKDEDQRLAETSTKLEEAIRREKEAVAERAKIAGEVVDLKEKLRKADEERMRYEESEIADELDEQKAQLQLTNDYWERDRYRLAEMSMKMEEADRKEEVAMANENMLRREVFGLNKKLHQVEEDHRKILRESMLRREVSGLDKKLQQVETDRNILRERLTQMSLNMVEATRTEKGATARETMLHREVFGLKKKLQQVEEDRNILRERLTQMSLKMEEAARNEKRRLTTANETKLHREVFDLNKKLQQVENDRKILRDRIDENAPKMARCEQQQQLQQLHRNNYWQRERVVMTEEIAVLKEKLHKLDEERMRCEERLAEMSLKLEEAAKNEKAATKKENMLHRVVFDLNKKLQQVEEDRNILRERFVEMTKQQHPQLQQSQQQLAASAAPLQPNETDLEYMERMHKAVMMG